MSAGWGQMIVDGLIASGVVDMVVCPGSRSASITKAAASSPLRCHPIYDERSAAFFAMGLSRVSARPTALVCTSGTAGAHFLPAIIEASLSGFPLVVITADRPPTELAFGAPQTIDQQNLFGSHVRAFVDLGCASADEGDQRVVWERLCKAIATSGSRPVGPIHLNVPFRKPLLGAAPTITRFEVPPPAPPSGTNSVQDAIQAVSAALRKAKRPLFVCGPLSPDRRDATAVASLAESMAVPVLAEATSQLRFGPRPRVRGVYRSRASPAAGSARSGATAGARSHH